VTVKPGFSDGADVGVRSADLRTDVCIRPDYERETALRRTCGRMSASALTTNGEAAVWLASERSRSWV